MSNPILQPDDRFRRPSLNNEEGRNRFADEAEPVPIHENSPQNEATAYQPRYETVLPHRLRAIAPLCYLGFVLSFTLILPFTTSYVIQGIIFGFLGVMLALAGATQAYRELSGISLGAVDPAGRDGLLIAYSFAMMGVILGFGVIAWCLIMILYGTMDLTG